MPTRRTTGAAVAGAAVAGYVTRTALGSFVGAGAEDLALSDGPELAPPGHAEFRRQFELVTGSAWRDGNHVTVLHNGDEIFPAMLDAIRAATSSVNFATFIYWAGDVGKAFADACIDRARAGVDVQVLLDAVGARPMDARLVKSMERAGCDVTWFRPVRSTHLGANNRSHRKILVVDGRVGFVGGVGIADEWSGDAQDPEHWRDTHVRLAGPIVRDVLGAFQEHWLEQCRVLLPSSYAPALDPAGTTIACCLRSSPSLAPTIARTGLQALVAAARTRVDLTTAYFAPGDGLVTDLLAAAERGVDVRVLVPGRHMDKRVVREAGRNRYDELIEGGVGIYEYEKTMLHAKVIAVDGAVSTCGSMNLDPRSFALNDECNVVFDDPEVADTFHRRFDDDLTVSTEITAGGRGLGSRARGIAAGLVRRQL